MASVQSSPPGSDDVSRPQLLTAAAFVCVGVGLLGLAAVSGSRPSAVSPTLPPGAGPSLPVRWVSDLTTASDRSLDTQAWVAVASGALYCLGFLMGLYLAWKRQLRLGVAVAVSLVVIAVAAALPLVFSHDVFQYGLYGRIAAVHHANPYVSVPADFPGDPFARYADPEFARTTSVYGPAFVQVAAFVSRLFRDPAGAIVAFKSIAAASAVATEALIIAVARRLRPERTALAVVVFGWNPAVMLLGVGGGHSDLLIALALVAALFVLTSPPAWSSTPRRLIAVTLLSLAASMKITLAVPLLLAVVAMTAHAPAGRRWRVGLAAVGWAVLVFGVLALPFVQGANPSLGFADLSRVSNGLSGQRALESILRPALDVVWAPRQAAVAAGYLSRDVLGGLIAVVLGFVCWRIYRRGSRLDAADLGALWAWSLLALALAQPVLFPWYVTWFAALIWLAEGVPLWCAAVASTLLSIVSVVIRAERVRDAYNTMVTIGETVVAPIILGLLVVLMVAAFRRWTSSDATVPSTAVGVG